MGGLVAKIEREELFRRALAVIVEAERLETECALLQPVMLSHAFDEQDFGGGSRVVVGAKAFVEFVEILAWLIGQDHEGSGETVAEGVQADPGFAFGVIGGLLTNFHLPQSSLLMLVAAFAGVDRVRTAYDAAIKERYRFYSYGDAMLITNS